MRRRLLVLLLVVGLAACGGGDAATDVGDDVVQRIRVALDEQDIDTPYLHQMASAGDGFDTDSISDADLRTVVSTACDQPSSVGELAFGLQLEGMVNGYFEDVVAVDRVVIEAACPDLAADFEQALRRVDADRVRHVPTVASELARLTEDAGTADGRIRLRLPVWPPPGSSDGDLPELSPDETASAFPDEVVGPLGLQGRVGPIVVGQLYTAIWAEGAFVAGAVVPETFGEPFGGAVRTETTIDGLPAIQLEHLSATSAVELTEP